MAAFTLQSLEPWADRGFARQSHFSILPIILDLVLMLMMIWLVTIQMYSFNAWQSKSSQSLKSSELKCEIVVLHGLCVNTINHHTNWINCDIYDFCDI